MAVVHVPPGEATPVAKALLEAADYLGLPASVVKTSSDGIFGFSFLVPDDVEHHWLHGSARRKPAETEEPEPEEAPTPKKRGRPRKAAAEPVVEEEE